MSQCHACLLRCLQAVAREASAPNRTFHAQRLLSSRLSNSAARRSASTAVATKSAFGNGLVAGRQPIADADSHGAGRRKEEGGVASQEQIRQLRLELQHLPDRVKFAEHVHYILRCDKPAKALDLCRLASKEREVVVAWNHCVDWHMQHNKPDAAIKIYNEMKKLAQFPDSYTYVLLLRGLARILRYGGPEHRKNFASKAVSIYTSMSSPTSRVKPSIMHTNAALQVCNAASDMDAVWGIVSKLPQTGPGAPDHMTYSILLNAIRFSAIQSIPRGSSLEQHAEAKDKAVLEGRQIWRDVVARWRSGEVQIDEDLVCHMARVLLMSKRMQDWDDVLDLVQQTMQIERLIPPLGSPDRHAEHVPRELELPERQATSEEDSEGFKDVPTAKAFRPIQPYPADSAHPKRPTSLAWVKPGNNILSIIIEACTLLRIPKAANAYWDLLTTQYGVKPDLLNFHTQLKLLAINRSSTRAVHLVRENIVEAGLEPNNQTFRIAMSVCARDRMNPNVLANAWTIVDIMSKTQVDVDIHTLCQYLDLALATDDSTKVVAALNKLDPIVHNLRSRVVFGSDETGISPADHIVNKEETLKFLRTMVGVIDRLMNRGGVPRESFGDWHARRNQLVQFIARTQNVIDQQKVAVDTKEAELRARREAKEAGRRERQQRYEARGVPEPRMSKAEWASKVEKNREKRQGARDAQRAKAAGMSRWDVSQTKAGYADSEMELSERH